MRGSLPISELMLVLLFLNFVALVYTENDILALTMFIPAIIVGVAYFTERLSAEETARLDKKIEHAHDRIDQVSRDVIELRSRVDQMMIGRR